ncbi:hypothetical protein C2S53_011364 [Perilla frutescens var. hirtella]|uniref:Uncharacterized protein n=1 Tax=Perilla frutescens var. hirtella TaxID=608512 RepID=A0AAD4P7N2_PERFH|nr:hypothetical protein C2S53_011364 [Perilla frutescens var. hirtella]
MEMQCGNSGISYQPSIIKNVIGNLEEVTLIRAALAMCITSVNFTYSELFNGVGSVSFMGFVYAAVISKLQSPSPNVIIRAIQNDWYYCFLVPLTLPILLVAVYFHWLSMKLFKHA